MFRPWLQRANLQMVEPVDDDAHDAYVLYAVRGDPSVSVGVTTEVVDGNVRRDSSFSGLDVQSLLGRITPFAGENVSLNVIWPRNTNVSRT